MSEATYQAAFAKRAAESYEKNFVPAIGAPAAGIDEERRTALERDYRRSGRPGASTVAKCSRVDSNASSRWASEPSKGCAAPKV